MQGPQPARLTNYFAETSYIKTCVDAGVARNRAGVRICTLTSDFMLGLRNAMIHECGQAADEVFRTCGRRWGTQVAKRFRSEIGRYYARPFEDLSMAVFDACLQQLFSHHGWGKVRVDYSLQNKGVLSVVLANPIYGSLSTSTEPVGDPLMAGMLAGFFSEIGGEQLDCVQTETVAGETVEARYVVSLAARMLDAPRWLEQGKRHDAVVLELVHVHV